MKVEFWGGPRDGDALFSAELPELEFIFPLSGDAAIDADYYYQEIKDFPGRSMEYHKYFLKSKDKTNFVYVYHGVE